jgi:uncharacterized cupredoxin-like copper-binding protein
MEMKGTIVAAVSILLAGTAALAGGSGNHSHGHDQMMNAGKPGKLSEVSRTVEIAMMEKDDGSMVFEPASLNFKHGETVRLLLTNKGQTGHEFVMDSHEGNQKHKKAMEKYPDMEHADPNAIRLEPGKSGEIVWTFAKSGNFEFACLMPGHYEAGMKGELVVDEKTASN